MVPRAAPPRPPGRGLAGRACHSGGSATPGARGGGGGGAGVCKNVAREGSAACVEPCVCAGSRETAQHAETRALRERAPALPLAVLFPGSCGAPPGGRGRAERGAKARAAVVTARSSLGICEKVLEFNCASACHCEPAERKGGDGGGSEWHSVDYGKTGIIMPAETFSPPIPQGCHYKSASFPLSHKKGGGHKAHSCQICLFSEGLRASKCQ